ncbi:MAG: hypothetical protein CMH49_03990 [Myxococcales bacterium]|nr:hypothetical protein [Myxococcales bacterium]
MSLIQKSITKSGLNNEFNEALNEQQTSRLESFLALRDAWAKTHNLSGPRALQLHSTDIVDALAVYLSINSKYPLIDIGSGSGVPGLMLACLMPELEIHLVEPIAKRCAFMKTALYKLGLKKVKVHRGRWPDTASAITVSSQAMMISRAVVSPEAWPLLAHQTQPAGIMQMLAQHRPQWPLEEYTLEKELKYFDPEGGERLIRRWVLK